MSVSVALVSLVVLSSMSFGLLTMLGHFFWRRCGLRWSVEVSCSPLGVSATGDVPRRTRNVRSMCFCQVRCDRRSQFLFWLFLGEPRSHLFLALRI